MRTHAINTLLVYFFLQSCASYEKTSVSLSQAMDKGTVLLVENGREKNFDYVVFKDSAYYGVKEKSKDEFQLELISDDGNAQTFLSKPKISNNVVYACYSGYMMSGPGFSVNYDRKIDKSIWLSTGVGLFPLSGEDSKMMNLKLTHLTGKRNSHVEFGLGITLAYSNGQEERVSVYAGTRREVPSHWDVFPAITIGYRYQRPGVGPIVRFGFGYLEANVGVGFNF